MAIQTQTFKKRLRSRSGLHPLARLVALVIADLRYEARVHGHEPLALTLADLTRETGLARSTVAARLAECVAAGWIRCEPMYRDGRQQANRYWITDPLSPGDGLSTDLLSPGDGLSTESGSRSQSDREPDPVVRSNYNVAGAAAPQGRAASRNEQESPPPEPAPAHAVPTYPEPCPTHHRNWAADPTCQSCRPNREFNTGQRPSDPPSPEELVTSVTPLRPTHGGSLARQRERELAAANGVDHHGMAEQIRALIRGA